jgi:hypothetical protein
MGIGRTRIALPLTRWQGSLFTFAFHMKRISILLPLTIAALLIGAGCASTATTNQNTSNTSSTTNTTSVTSVTYAGQNGKNALELLQAAHTVDVSSAGFVNAIDGVKPADRQYWALYVNTKLAEKGAKEIITSSSDTIVWQLESY